MQSASNRSVIIPSELPAATVWLQQCLWFITWSCFVFNFPSSSQRAFPYISVMLGNGTVSYDHDRDGRPTELGGCTAMVRNAIYDTFLLVRYSKNQLTVWDPPSGGLMALLTCSFISSGNKGSEVSNTQNWALFTFTCDHAFTPQLMVDVDGKQAWRDCAAISGVRLPTGYFLGASSATGDLSGVNLWIMWLYLFNSYNSAKMLKSRRPPCVSL